MGMSLAPWREWRDPEEIETTYRWTWERYDKVRYGDKGEKLPDKIIRPRRG
jgi:hypothetical protein